MNGFKENLNYLVAFIAILVGLLVFKEQAEANSVNLLGLSVSFFWLSIPFLSGMVIAAYIGALAIIAGQVNFTRFPIVKILERVSYTIMAFSLLYPLGVAAAYLMTLLIQLILHIGPMIDSTITESLASLISGLLTGAVLSMVSFNYAKNKEKNRIRNQIDTLIINIDQVEYAENKDKDGNKELSFLRHYEELVGLANSYLSAIGYGSAYTNLKKAADILHNIQILDKDDVGTAVKLNEYRNAIAHHSKPDQLPKLDHTTFASLRRLRNKLKKAIYDFSPNSMEDGKKTKLK